MRYHSILLSLICMLFTAHSALADKRVAFVVGNGAYKNVAQLPNPPIDAKAMASVLRNVGFEVVEGVNLTRDKMTEKLLDFGKRAQGFAQHWAGGEPSRARRDVPLFPAGPALCRHVRSGIRGPCHSFPEGPDDSVVVAEDQIEPIWILRDASDAA